MENKEEVKLNIYQKLQKSRVELQQRKIKKTGSNKYANYDYFELGDFLPGINEICNNNGLTPIFHFEPQLATLTVIDCDNIENKIEFTTPIEIATLKGCSNIQNIGGTQSYARRYLYMMAFEIAESDIVDGGEIDQDAEQGKRKIDKASVFVINKLLEETNSDKEKFLNYMGVKKVEDITNDCLGACMRDLNKKKEKIEKAKKEADKKNEFPADLL
jgi:hypothetical protein